MLITNAPCVDRQGNTRGIHARSNKIGHAQNTGEWRFFLSLTHHVHFTLTASWVDVVLTAPH